MPAASAKPVPKAAGGEADARVPRAGGCPASRVPSLWKLFSSSSVISPVAHSVT